MAAVFLCSFSYLVALPLAEPDAVPDVPPVVPLVPLEPIAPEPLVPLVEPPALPMVVLGEALVSVLAEPLVPLALVLPGMEPEVPDEAVVLGVDELVSLDAVELDGVEADVLGVLVVLLVLLRSQPAAKVATVIAAKMGIRRFMTSPIQCVRKMSEM